MSETLPVAPVVLAHAAPFSLGPLAVRPATREVAGCGFRDRCSFADASCAGRVPKQGAGPAHHYLCRLAP